MKKLNGSRSRLLTGLTIIVAIIIITDSCTKKAMSDLYGTSASGGIKGVPGTNEVWIQGMAFTPSVITVVAGTKITFTNKDAIAHTVTSDAGLFESGQLKSGDTFNYTFSTVGSFTYHCSNHTTMTATVIVTATPVATASVSIDNNMSFAPSTLSVSAGTIVTWTNNDAINHTVTSDSGLFDSGAIPAAALYVSPGTFIYIFSTPGTYSYHCSIHPTMTGTVIVN
jgi:plastocyanin